MPLTETIDLLRPHFNNKEIDLFIHCLTSSYFLWNNTFYEQTDGVAMGSPLSPMVANFFMEHFETQALTSAIDKPTRWFRYVDDTLVIWPHGEEKLTSFLAHLNSIHENIILFRCARMLVSLLRGAK